MIKNVVFDMGGVIAEWKPREIIARLLPQSERREWLYEHIMLSPEWGMMDKGEITNEQAAERLAASAGELAGEVLRVMRGWPAQMPLIEGTPKLMRRLKGRGLGVYILSNASDAFWQIGSVKPALALADGVLVSCETGLSKPDVRIYELFCERFSLKAEECLFTDDMAQNIEGAKKAGMRALLFEGPSALEKELITLGLLQPSQPKAF
ncbi:MAG: HAD family phosphatase [Oscillospiraceae bacterium]|nr:HAD family phosphatase [Oscillospiraceae bacterium]